MGLRSFFRTLTEIEKLKTKWLNELAKLEQLLEYNMQTTKAILLVLKKENILGPEWIVPETKPKKEE